MYTMVSCSFSSQYNVLFFSALSFGVLRRLWFRCDGYELRGVITSGYIGDEVLVRLKGSGRFIGREVAVFISTLSWCLITSAPNAL